MTPKEQLEQMAINECASWVASLSMGREHNSIYYPRYAFIAGGLKGMEIQRKLDRQEIERLQDLLIRAYNVIPPFKYEDLCAEIEKELKL